MEIFAIGHSNYPYEKFLNMIKKYNINCIVDIRKTPYSRYNIQYNREYLSKKLKEDGYLYIHMGKEFGVKRDTIDSYNDEGYSDFEKVVKEEVFLSGVNRIKKGLEMGYKIVLLGAMQEPIRCHRAILVGRFLNENGIKVNYILNDGTLVNQLDIEEQLLNKYFEDRMQINMDSLLGKEITKQDLINQAYKLANKEIGYRSEKIKV